MIGIVQQGELSESINLVQMALVRSTANNLVTLIQENNIDQHGISVFVLINPTESLLNRILAKEKAKVVVFGKLPAIFTKKYQTDTCKGKEIADGWDRSPIADSHRYAESLGYIEYTNLSHTLFGFSMVRPLERFDFTDEWNNLGYGRIRYDNSIWAISDSITLPSKYSLSNVKIDNEVISTYSAIFDELNVSICWFNRAVGPIDSPEWHVIEKFISSYRPEDLPCVPVLLEIPQSYDAAVTMRLDCDEDIESCRYLWEAYRKLDVPFSVAIHTKNLEEHRHHSIVKEMHNSGVSIMSHTATHAPNWGGSYESAVFEANESSNKIEELIGEKVKYAVSPFHQAPPYALKALFDTGYKGCVGGIIRNDPEFLFQSGGNVTGLPRSFIGHSQQVMLHGDCILDFGDPIGTYKESFNLSKTSFSIFGYLDHPFSERYSYGWKSEEQRAQFHRDLIDYIRSSTEKVVFLSENQALDFIYDKSFINVDISEDTLVLSYNDGYIPEQSYIPKVLYKNAVLDDLSIN